MPKRIEDYALIGNCATAGLVGRDGSIDWLGFPRFDSAACFAALLGTPDHGRWKIAPADAQARVTRRYRDGTLVLETDFATPAGSVRVTDCMSLRDGDAIGDVIRLVTGLSGAVAMAMELVVRFEYGALVPWVSRREDGRLGIIAGPDQLVLSAPVEIRGENLKTVAEFTVRAGEELAFTLSWAPSYDPTPSAPDGREVTQRVTSAWQKWSARYKPEDGQRPEWNEAVLRSLITLKALTHHRTGGIVAAATTSLPETPGGVRNWDYRFCWLRDSTFTLYALMESGFTEEAVAWREWLLRAVAGAPTQMQIMYGIAGERRLTEYDVPWLPGFEGAVPVRIGNAASSQVQLDVYGEVLDSLYQARKMGIKAWDPAWDLQTALVEHLAEIWQEPDEGLWEVRGGRRQFTHSKVMAWVALDRAVRSIEEFGLKGPLDRWRALRDAIHAEVCRSGYDAELGSFVQSYGAKTLDASLLLMPLVGFLPPDDPRIQGTIATIEKSLLKDGLVARYDTDEAVDGLIGREGAFLACSFWLADNYALQGRYDEATALFERLLALRNDVGLLAEEYDPVAKCLLGNFPQAFSHVGLINTAHNLIAASGPAQQRAEGAEGKAAAAE